MEICEQLESREFGRLSWCFYELRNSNLVREILGKKRKKSEDFSWASPCGLKRNYVIGFLPTSWSPILLSRVITFWFSSLHYCWGELILACTI